MALDIRFLLKALIKYRASDLHLKPGRSPLYRINGKIAPAKMEELTSEQIEGCFKSLLSDKQRAELRENRVLDFSFSVQDYGRFRCNLFYQKAQLSAAIRAISSAIPALGDLGIPQVIKELAQRPHGLLLITGSTGSGKSTTLASVVQYLNENFPFHILTMEDPIEYVFRDLKSAISQREVGSDIVDLNQGLISSLRQDPDIIVIGELRNYQMIQAALTAAETGHLVISTLHTSDAKGTLDRVLDVCPPDAKNQVRIQLASSLIGVFAQQLVNRIDGTGRIAAVEVMIKSPAIENYILKNELSLISDAIANSSNYYQMQTMNLALIRLVQKGLISTEEAMKASANPEDLRLNLAGIQRGGEMDLDSARMMKPARPSKQKDSLAAIPMSPMASGTSKPIKNAS